MVIRWSRAGNRTYLTATGRPIWWLTLPGTGIVVGLPAGTLMTLKVGK